MEMSPVVKNIIGAIVRWLLVAIGGILVKKGIISTAQSTIYVEQALPAAIGAAMALVALIWAIWQKRHANQKVELALALPAGTTRKTLEKEIDAGVKPL